MNNEIKSKKPLFGTMPVKNTINAENTASLYIIEAQNKKPEFDISDHLQHAKTN